MRYHALATDYDGTIAHDGGVDAPTLAALERLRATGRRLLLVTGRELPDLLRTFAHIHLFDLVVGENGALLYRPSDKNIRLLAEAPPPGFVEELERRGVGPISVGESIVATWVPHENTVLDVIRDMGLELQVIFNKDAVMVLPAGVNKATGLKAALKELKLSPHEVVGVGDAENDHAFLALCECSVAVANALPAIKERADLVTDGPRGEGVAQLIDRLAADDLASLGPKLMRHHFILGKAAEKDVTLDPQGATVLVAGPSGSGKSTATTSFLERLMDHGYQFCIIDPEGDYEGLEKAQVLGGKQPPTGEEVVRLLETPGTNVVANLIGMALADRPAFLLSLLPRLLEMRAKTGRPHWIVLDEAHHLMPVSWAPGETVFPSGLDRAVFITVHPDQVAKQALAKVNTVLAVGAPRDTLEQFGQAAGQQVPGNVPEKAGEGEVYLWRKGGEGAMVALTPCKTQRHRHVRKYAEGELPPDRSFYFTGPQGAMKLRAQNLVLFAQMADGVDDATWTHHLGAGDVSRWFRDHIKDSELAEEAAAVEKATLTPQVSRERIKEAIAKRYTMPATGPLPMPGTDAAPVHQE
ncbi:MAG: HAD family hydrolase [Gemmataceae bacterium]|nr:HAD family hydrolase [Gemmataceae bacterium]